MYSEQFVQYLLKYQNEDFKVAQKKPEKKFFRFNDVAKKKYATVPISSK